MASTFDICITCTGSTSPYICKRFEMYSFEKNICDKSEKVTKLTWLMWMRDASASKDDNYQVYWTEKIANSF